MQRNAMPSQGSVAQNLVPIDTKIFRIEHDLTIFDLCIFPDGIRGGQGATLFRVGVWPHVPHSQCTEVLRCLCALCSEGALAVASHDMMPGLN